MTKELDDQRRAVLNNLTLIFFVFSALCLGSALFMGSAVESKRFGIPAKGGMVGPVEVPKKNAVFLFEVTQGMKVNNWTYVTVEVLDKDKKFLHAFGDEFWSETGRDSDGNWSESHLEFDMKITFDEPGTYFFKVVTEASNFKAARKVVVRYKRLRGSSVAFWWLCFISLGVGIVINEVNRRTIITWIEENSD
ncbi:MAG: hypothetical protein R8G66_18315 [Cytophagales bacterium]|nr:hypothetical protein [Cytophagales bacterium]